MSEVKYAIAILKEKLANADRHNLAYQRLSIAEMEAIWGTLEKSDKDYTALKADRDALAAAHSELRESMAAIHNRIRLDGVNTSLGALLSASKRAHEASVPTDAHLNSVRAEGVEAFAHQQRVIADATPAAAFQRDRRFAAGLAEDFAAQLRAGKDGE